MKKFLLGLICIFGLVSCCGCPVNMPDLRPMPNFTTQNQPVIKVPVKVYKSK